MTLSFLLPLSETPRDLAAYLRKMPLTHVAGTRESGDCVLSRFFIHTYRQQVFVTDHLIIIGSEEHALSPWMTEFICAVRVDRRKLTAGVALELLDRCEGRIAA